MPHVAISVAVIANSTSSHIRKRGAANFRADPFGHAAGCGRARDERHEPDEPATILLEWHVEHGLHFAIESPLSDVRDHAHHRQPFAAIVQTHSPAKRLTRTTRKIFAYDALA